MSIPKSEIGLAGYGNKSAMTNTTPTGVPIEHCGPCGYEHPVTQKHCKACGRSSLFIHPDNDHCLRCGWPDD